MVRALLACDLMVGFPLVMSAAQHIPIPYEVALVCLVPVLISMLLLLYGRHKLA